MAVEPQDIINRATEVLQRDGWCQHEAHSDDGKHCTLGALHVAAIELLDDASYTKQENMDAVKLVCREIINHYPQFYLPFADQGTDLPADQLVSIPAFNDDHETTQEDVLLVLKHAGHRG